MKTFLILGASRGLGEALATDLPKLDDITYLVSRTEPSLLKANDGITRYWIKADLSSPSAVEIIRSSIQDKAIDVLIYNAGIWEVDTFQKTPDSLIESIIHINLTSALLVIKSFLSNVAQSNLRKIILIGSTSGTENNSCTDVAYTASKFGLRGATHALRELGRPLGIAVTCINPGGIAADMPISKGKQAALDLYEQKRIPVQDICELTQCILNLSPASCVKEINMPALLDRDV